MQIQITDIMDLNVTDIITQTINFDQEVLTC